MSGLVLVVVAVAVVVVVPKEKPVVAGAGAAAAGAPPNEKDGAKGAAPFAAFVVAIDVVASNVNGAGAAELEAAPDAVAAGAVFPKLNDGGGGDDDDEGAEVVPSLDVAPKAARKTNPPPTGALVVDDDVVVVVAVFAWDASAGVVFPKEKPPGPIVPLEAAVVEPPVPEEEDADADAAVVVPAVRKEKPPAPMAPGSGAAVVRAAPGLPGRAAWQLAHLVSSSEL